MSPLPIPQGESIDVNFCGTDTAKKIPFLKCPCCDVAFFRGIVTLNDDDVHCMKDWAEMSYFRHYQDEHLKKVRRVIDIRE